MNEEHLSLRIPEEFVDLYPAERDALFDFVRSNTTDEMIWAIAGCENGIDREENAAALARLRAGHDLDQSLRWIPNEVLTMFPWGGEQIKVDLGVADDACVALAFCYSLQLRVPDVNGHRGPFDQWCLAGLMSSCQQLGEPYRQRLPPPPSRRRRFA